MGKKSAQPKATCVPKEFTGFQWHARKIVGTPIFINDKVHKQTITIELVWGKLVREANGDTKIIGDAYHQLHGATAQKSIDDYAARLNRDKVPPSRAKKCIADGARAPKDGGKDQMTFAMTFKPTPTAP